MTLKARVKAGRLVVDEPTNLREAPKSSFFLSTLEIGSTTAIVPHSTEH